MAGVEVRMTHDVVSIRFISNLREYAGPHKKGNAHWKIPSSHARLPHTFGQEAEERQEEL